LSYHLIPIRLSNHEHLIVFAVKDHCELIQHIAAQDGETSRMRVEENVHLAAKQSPLARQGLEQELALPLKVGHAGSTNASHICSDIQARGVNAQNGNAPLR